MGWLLEHQDQVMELQEPGGQVQQGTGDTEAGEQFSDTDSILESFEDIDASVASEGVLGAACIPPPETFKRRVDFKSKRERLLCEGQYPD